LKSHAFLQSLDGFSFYLLAILLIWVPIPIGSNPNWSIGILTILSIFVFILTYGSALLNNRSFGVIKHSLLAASLLFGFLLLTVIQYLYGYNPEAVFLSLDKYATKVQILLTVSYILIFLSTILSCSSTGRVKRLCWIIVLSGALQSLIAIILFSSQAKYQIFFLELDHSTRAKGTFSYHNSFAGYMEMCIAVGLGMLIGSYKTQSKVAKVGNNIYSILDFILSSKIILRLLVILMVIGLVLTRSRMGNAGLMIALLISLLVGLYYLKEERKYLSILLLSVFIIDSVVIGQWVGIDKVIARLESTDVTKQELVKNDVKQPNNKLKKREESVEQRSEPAYNTIEMIKERPWFGFGAGTFYTAYPPYKNPSVKGYYEHAHNDYLEIASDSGLVGAFLLFGFGFLCLVRSVKLLSSDLTEYKGVGFSAVISLFAIAIHSLVDFNLHIPANVTTLMVICALPYACGYIASKRSDKS
jgi:O-antigen ligase